MGWAARNSAFTILYRSLIAWVICYFVGKTIGHFAQRTIEQNIEAYKRDNPIPPDPVADSASRLSSVNVDIIEDSDDDKSEPAKEPVTSRSAA